jgi:antitoxin component YwqK of YwqJK toxin-antitoxin module
MKQIKLITAALIIIAAVSCTKSKNELPQPPQEMTVKKLTSFTSVYENNPAITFDMTYDAQGRISTYKFQNYSFVFSYAGSKLNIVRKKLSDGQPDQYIECDLNENGAIVKQVSKNIDNTVGDISEFTYDAIGQMIKHKFTDGPDIYEEVLTYANGNAVSSTLIENGVPAGRRENYYDEKILNKVPFAAISYWASDRLFGKTTRNMLIGSKTFNTNNVLTSETKQAYELDANNYPVKVTANFLPSGAKMVTAYTFQ